MSNPKRVPAEVFHPSEFIREEMEARGWTADELARRMGGDSDLNRLCIDMYFAVHDPNLRIGNETAEQLGRAFDVSPEYFLSLEKAWRDHPSMRH